MEGAARPGTSHGKVMNKSSIKPFKNGLGQLFDFHISYGISIIKCVAFSEQADRLFTSIEPTKHVKISGGRLKKANTKFNTTGHPFELQCDSTTMIVNFSE